MRALAHGSNDRAVHAGDSGRSGSPAWRVYGTLEDDGTITMPSHRLVHPAFPQAVGEGIYDFETDPVIIRNFAYGPLQRAEVSATRTASSSVITRREQPFEDVEIELVWLATEGRVATAMASMFRKFFEFWRTPPGIGETVGWEPRPITQDRFRVVIQNVELGGPNFEYFEVRPNHEIPDGAVIDRQLTLTLRLARGVVPPLGAMALEGR